MNNKIYEIKTKEDNYDKLFLSYLKSNNPKEYFLYISGHSGLNKTLYTKRLLSENNYEVFNKSIFDIKNEETFFELLNQKSILTFFNKTKTTNKFRVLLIDNIDNVQSSEKKVIALITKLIKKNKEITKKNIKIIFMGNNEHDKKIKELQNVCVHFKIRYNLDNIECYDDIQLTIQNIVKTMIYENNDKITFHDKTTLALLFHENIIDVLDKLDINKKIDFYYEFIENICHGDYYDRISFQKQLWQFNDLTFTIKVLQNYNLLKNIKSEFVNITKPNEMRFTKILTKYSNEYSNMNFINQFCIDYSLTRQELYVFLINIKNDDTIDVKYQELNNKITPTELKRLMKIFNLLD
jgi:hypothetical protein